MIFDLIFGALACSIVSGIDNINKGYREKKYNNKSQKSYQYVESLHNNAKLFESLYCDEKMEKEIYSQDYIPKCTSEVKDLLDLNILEFNNKLGSSSKNNIIGFLRLCENGIVPSIAISKGIINYGCESECIVEMQERITNFHRIMTCADNELRNHKLPPMKWVDVRRFDRDISYNNSIRFGHSSGNAMAIIPSSIALYYWDPIIIKIYT